MFFIGSGLIGYFVKKIFEYYLDKNLDKYRLQLDKENENHRHKLVLITQEHQIRYNKLHNERAEVIKNLYQKLVNMEQFMRSYMAPVQFNDGLTRTHKQEKAGEAAQIFFDYFYPNEIFFDQSTCTLISEMNKIYSDAWIDFTTYDDETSRQMSIDDKEFRKERAKVWIETWKTINQNIPPIKEKLINEFRILLGVKNNANNKELEAEV